jgi:hypothetical protein
MDPKEYAFYYYDTKKEPLRLISKGSIFIRYFVFMQPALLHKKLNAQISAERILW